jgi:hypothetical protein
MPYRAPRRLSWTVRHGASGELDDRILKELIDACRNACEHQFPSGRGYDVTTTVLRGPIEGVNLEVVGADVRGLVSVQRYRRLVGLAELERRPTEIRVVAAARTVSTDAALTRAPPPGRAAIITLGTVAAFGVVGLASAVAGLLTAWGIALVLLPTLIGLRLAWALRVAHRLRAHAPPIDPPFVPDDRWHQLICDLERQRETTAGRLSTRPFRDVG